MWIDEPDEREPDERQRADDPRRSLGFRAHRADLEHHLGALAEHVGEVRQGLGEVAAGLALDRQSDHEELEFRGAEAVRGFLQRDFHRPADFHLVGDHAELDADRPADFAGDDSQSFGDRQTRTEAGTISSIASGKFELNFLMRRWIILPIMKCGPPTPKNRPSSSDSRIGAPRSITRPATTREMVRQIVAYLPSVISLPVISSRLRIKAGLGIRDEAKPSIPPTRCAISFRICAWALPATMSPWRSFTSSMRRFSAFDADGPRTARAASTSAPKPPIRMIHKSMSCLCLSLARPGEPRPPDWLRRLGRLRLRQHRLQIIDQVLGARRGLGFRGGSPVLGGMAEHPGRRLGDRAGHLPAADFGRWLAG